MTYEATLARTMTNCNETKGHYGFPVCGSANAHVHVVSYFGYRHTVLLEASVRSLLHFYE